MATSAFTSLRRRAPSRRSRSAGSVRPGVRRDRQSGIRQGRGDVLGGRDRQRVDDAAARQLVQVRHEPAQALLGRHRAQHPEAQRVACQPAANREHRPAADLELLDDVGDDAGVGGGGRRQHGCVGRQPREQVADAPVVGPEVVAPVADAVGLVDHEQPAPAGQVGQLLIAKSRVVEPFRAHEEHVDGVGRERGPHLVPVLGVGRVHRHGADAGSLGRRDLVSHQRQERADDDGRPGPFRPAQRGRHEVDRRLAPPGALHDEHPGPVGHEGGDRLELTVAEVGVVAPDEPAQRGAGRLGERRGGGARGVRSEREVASRHPSGSSWSPHRMPGDRRPTASSTALLATVAGWRRPQGRARRCAPCGPRSDRGTSGSRGRPARRGRGPRCAPARWRRGETHRTVLVGDHGCGVCLEVEGPRGGARLPEVRAEQGQRVRDRDGDELGPARLAAAPAGGRHLDDR